MLGRGRAGAWARDLKPEAVDAADGPYVTTWLKAAPLLQIDGSRQGR